MFVYMLTINTLNGALIWIVEGQVLSTQSVLCSIVYMLTINTLNGAFICIVEGQVLSTPSVLCEEFTLKHSVVYKTTNNPRMLFYLTLYLISGK